MAVAGHSKEDTRNNWLLSEKLYAQNFFYQGRYFNTLNCDFNLENGTHVNAKCKQISPAKKIESKETTEAKPLTVSPHRNVLKPFEAKRRLVSYPEPGNAANSMLNVFDYFYNGLNKLYPNDEMSNQLISTLSESDNVYLMVGLHSIALKVDNILRSLVTSYVDKQYFNIDSSDSREDVIKKIIDDVVSKTKTLHAVKQKPDVKRMSLMTENLHLGNGTSSTIWHVDSEMKLTFLNEHKIDFIDSQSYICYLCNGIFSTNPATHIIKPSHISALADYINVK